MPFIRRRLFLPLLFAAAETLSAGTALGSAAPASSPAKKFEITGGATKFLAVGRPSALKINGEGSAPKGSIVIADGKAAGELAVDLSSFKTGIETRDRHMKEKYLEVEKPGFQFAKLTIVDCSPPASFLAGDSAKAENVPFKGKLRLHGAENEASGTVNLSRQGNSVNGEASFDVKIPDYGISIPSFAGVTVADKVTVVAVIKGVDQGAAPAPEASLDKAPENSAAKGRFK